MLITDPLFYAVAIPVVLLSGISRTGIPGFSSGIAVPLLSLVIPPLQAAALVRRAASLTRLPEPAAPSLPRRARPTVQVEGDERHQRQS